MLQYLYRVNVHTYVIQLVSSNLRHTINRIYVLFCSFLDIWLWFEFFGRSFHIYTMNLDINALERNVRYSQCSCVYQISRKFSRSRCPMKNKFDVINQDQNILHGKFRSICFWQQCSKFMWFILCMSSLD